MSELPFPSAGIYWNTDCTWCYIEGLIDRFSYQMIVACEGILLDWGEVPHSPWATYYHFTPILGAEYTLFLLHLHMCACMCGGCVFLFCLSWGRASNSSFRVPLQLNTTLQPYFYTPLWVSGVEHQGVKCLVQGPNSRATGSSGSQIHDPLLT